MLAEEEKGTQTPLYNRCKKLSQIIFDDSATHFSSFESVLSRKHKGIQVQNPNALQQPLGESTRSLQRNDHAASEKKENGQVEVECVQKKDRTENGKEDTIWQDETKAPDANKDHAISLSQDETSDSSPPLKASDCIVEISFSCAIFSKRFPWHILSENTFDVQGLVVPGRRILTWHPNLRFASPYAVVSRRRARYRAEFIGMHCSSGTALLKIDDEQFWKEVNECEFVQELGKAKDESYFHLDKDIEYSAMSWNENFQSKDIKRFSAFVKRGGEMCIESHPRIYNIDGTVLFDEDSRVIGLATKNISSSYRIGIIGAGTLQRWLEEWEERGGGTLDSGGLGFNWTALASERTGSTNLKQYYNIDEEQTGVIVLEVGAYGGAHGFLEQGDFITKVNGYQLNDDGNLTVGNDKITGLAEACNTLMVGDEVEFELIRNRECISVKYPLKRFRSENIVEEANSVGGEDYIVYGGLVFKEATAMFRTSGQSTGDQDNPYSGYIKSLKQSEDERLVVISARLDHDINIGYIDQCNKPVISFNNTKVKNLPHLAMMIENCEEEFAVFKVEGNVTVVFDRQREARVASCILEENFLPALKRITPRGNMK